MLVGEPCPDDEAALLELIAQPVGAPWTTACELPAGLQAGLATYGERVAIAVARAHGRVIGCGVRAVRPVWWEGRPAWLGYRTLLRCAPTVSPWRLPALLAACHAHLEAARAPDELPWDLTSILADNRPARRLLTRGLPGVPAYQELGPMVARLLPARGGTGDGRPAVAADRDALTALLMPRADEQLLPRTDLASLAGWLVQGPVGAPQACLRLTDQRGRRRARLVALPVALRRCRLLVNLLPTGFPALPAPGARLDEGFLDHVRAAPGQDGLLPGLVRHAMTCARAAGLRVVVTMCAPGGRPVAANWYAVGVPVVVHGRLDQAAASL